MRVAGIERTGRLNSSVIWRLTVLTTVWLAEILLALYAGIGYTVLLGYLVLLVFLAVPLRTQWLDSTAGRVVFGRVNKPEVDRFLHEMSGSKSYRVTVAVTAVVLLAVSVLIIVSYNYTIIELLR
jgi:hypothetical protein